jgi:hypothetical protein
VALVRSTSREAGTPLSGISQRFSRPDGIAGGAGD